MGGRPKRGCTSDSSNDANGVPAQKFFIEGPSAPATKEDKCRWKGFCEIESEPAFFNVMLKRFGVKGVKVKEVVSLDEDILMFIPRPIYGLIFLFKWIEEDPDKQEASCPDGVWFANQTVNNACASVALLNIVNNVPGLELGDNLQQFKEFSASFSPALRGDAIGNFEFVKDVHNSFARKMDMLNADLLLENEATAAKGKGKKRSAGEDEHEAGFHFIAFLPIDDQLWKLDGLERQPMCLGASDEDWLSQAKPDIEARMAQYEEGQIEFAILSLVQDPLIKLIPALAENLKNVAALSARLDAIKPDWQESTTSMANGGSDGKLDAPDPAHGLTQKELDSAVSSQEVVNLCEMDVLPDIVEHREELITAQAELRVSIREELQSDQTDEERAAARSRDYGARLQNFVRTVRTKRAVIDSPDIPA